MFISIRFINIINMVFDTTAGNKVITGGTMVGTTAIQLVTTQFSGYSGITIKSNKANVGNIYVGVLGVTTSTVAIATSGYELAPGEPVYIPISNVNLIFVIADNALEKVTYLLQ